MTELVHDIGEDVVLASDTLIVEDDQESLIVEEERMGEDIEVNSWNTADDFVSYIKTAMRSFPEHGDSKYGALYAIAYGERLRDEMIDTVSQGDNEFNIEQLRELDKIDNTLNDKIEALHATLSLTTGAITRDKQKGLTKIASGIHYRTNPFIAAIARLLINAKISGGKNIETLYSHLQDKYGLDERDRLQIQFALLDMGYKIRGSFIDGEDMITQYVG